MKSSLKISRFCLTSVAGGVVAASLSFAAGNAVADDIRFLIAAEDESFSQCGGTQLVRFGDYDNGCTPGVVCLTANNLGKWNYKAIDGNGWCKNTTFGDPFPNRRKRCQRVVDLGYYQFIAKEGDLINPGYINKWVVYGMLSADGKDYGQFTPRKQIKDGDRCNLATFSPADPAPGREKACFFYHGPL